MQFRLLSRVAQFAAVAGLVSALALAAQDSNHRGRKYKAPPQTARVEVTVLRSDDGKPVENAAVVFRLLSEKGSMELKSNEDGKAIIDVFPMGAEVLLQVIAKGYQTYGDNFTISQSNQALEVKLKRPGKQYSVYEKHNTGEQLGTGAGPDITEETKKGTTAPAAAKPSDADSKAEPESKPDTQKPDSAPPADSGSKPQ